MTAIPCDLAAGRLAPPSTTRRCLAGRPHAATDGAAPGHAAHEHAAAKRRAGVARGPDRSRTGWTLRGSHLFAPVREGRRCAASDSDSAADACEMARVPDVPRHAAAALAPERPVRPHSTVTLLAKFLGLSTSVPRTQAVW